MSRRADLARLLWIALEGAEVDDEADALIRGGAGGVVLFSRNIAGAAQLRTLIASCRASARNSVRFAPGGRPGVTRPRSISVQRSSKRRKAPEPARSHAWGRPCCTKRDQGRTRQRSFVGSSARCNRRRTSGRSFAFGFAGCNPTD
jgi:hypothetical protein